MNKSSRHATASARVDVYFMNRRPYCTNCEQDQCEHVTFALSIPLVIEELKAKGWNVEEGRISQSPF